VGALSLVDELIRIERDRQATARTLSNSWLPEEQDRRGLALAQAYSIALYSDLDETWDRITHEALLESHDAIDQLIGLSDAPLMAGVPLDMPPPATTQEARKLSDAILDPHRQIILKRAVTLLCAEYRRAARSGEDDRAIAALRAALRLGKAGVEDGTLIGALMWASNSVGCFDIASHVAIADEASASLIRSSLELLEPAIAHEPDPDRIIEHERVFHELMLWSHHARVRRAPIADVVESVWDSIVAPSQTPKPPLWIARRQSYEDAVIALSRFYDHFQRIWSEPVESLGALRQGPSFPSLAVVDVDLYDTYIRARQSLTSLKLEKHWICTVLRIELFRAEHGRLPDSLLEAMAAERANALLTDLPYRYEKLSDDAFALSLPDSPWYPNTLTERRWATLEDEFTTTLRDPFEPVEAEDHSEIRPEFVVLPPR